MITAKKKVISDLTLCYCVSILQHQGNRCLLVASEKQYPCLLFDENGDCIDTVWEGPGGTMSAVQLPDQEGAFLATHRFFSPNNSKEASIILCTYEKGPDDPKGSWQVRTLLDLPCVHRFGILRRSGVNYLLACTIKEDYEYMDDWRLPGKVYAAVIPEDILSKPESYRLDAKVICPSLRKNHGFSMCGESALVSAEEGVFRFTPPASSDDDWNIEQLIDEPTSEALLLDLDDDGEQELVTFSPFHGDKLRVFKSADPSESRFSSVYTYGESIDFAHALCPAALGNKRIVIIGHRRGNRDLLALYWTPDGYRVDCLDHDVGPANTLSFNNNGKTFVLSANREINEVALYQLEEGD